MNAASDVLFEMLQPQRLTAVVDIGANPIDSEPPYKKMLANGLCTVIGFEPQDEARAELDRGKGPLERYFPHVVGDGRDKTLYVCAARGMTSLLPPDTDHLALFSGYQTFGRVEREIPVATRRLDDIAEVEELDFLKIDCQGAEQEVLKSGVRKLSRAVAIQTEVSFVTLYRNQPALGAVDTTLRALGFIPHCFADIKFWPIAPMVIDGNPRRPLRQLLEADILYVRDFSRLDNMDGEQWKHLAMIAHHCYGSADLALRAIAAAAQIGALPETAPAQYFELQQTLKQAA